jgi:hypothetical protein
MTYISQSSMKSGSRGGKFAAALVFSVLLGLALTPAQAKDRGDSHERAWRGHEKQAYSWHQRHHEIVEGEGPAVVYAPPTDYYAPDYYTPPPSPGISLFLPLNFR